MNSNFFSLLSFLFIIYSCSNKSVNACEDFKKLIKSKRDMSDTSKLLSLVDDFLEKKPRCIDALLTRADFLMSINDSNSAKDDYRKVLAISSSNIYALYRIGMLNEISGNNDSAAYYFRVALKEKEKNGGFIDFTNKLKAFDDDKSKYDVSTIELIYQNGIVSYYLRDVKMALKNFELCIFENYNLNQAYLYRGAIFFESGKSDSACKDFNISLKLGNQEAKNYLEKYCK